MVTDHLLTRPLCLKGAPIEIGVGTFFLYKLLGVSSFVGLAITCVFIPMNHFASKVVVRAQDNLMKARDERVALMNEVSIHSACHLYINHGFQILGGIRMLKVRCPVEKMSYIIDARSLWPGSVISRRRF